MTQADHDTELQDWIDSLDDLLERKGNEHVEGLLRRLQAAAYRRGVRMPFSANTPQINTIPVEQQVAYPGDLELERRIKSLVRWNAMAMVVRANREADGIGGHISTYASAATLYEVAFNHFFRAPTNDQPGDIVYFQGHAAPGIYARAFLEGRLSREQLENFRRELKPGGGLSSYPHPWLMPGFWQFPTVSMGLAPLMAIYQARFNRYLEDRGLLPHGSGRVWAFIGDGETDEPESRGAISVAAREQLDNLVFVINCNLQRLDGPVRGNGQIIQELEALLRGAGWNVIKVVLGGDWDPLLAKDEHGRLVERWTEVLDGELQKYTVEPGSYLREHFWGKHPELAAMVAHLSDAQLKRLRLGGHDPVKLFAAYKAATEHRGAPTAILARTIKGYGLGEAGEGRNVTHQQKKLNEEELREFRARFGIPISDEDLARAPLYRPPDDSPEVVYIRQRREQLGGFLPERRVQAAPLEPPPAEPFAEFFEGTGERPVSTTMAFVRLLARLMKHERFGPLVVPIVPDEARTFGMESLFRQFGIYSHAGQLYEPVDAGSLLYYREATDGQILEEGITEAGAMGSFIAAGTAYATHGINTIPFFIYYSMFGFQRIGDLIWAAADMRVKGFLVGATAGRTTLAGEGLQHQDGHSHHLMQVVPTLRCYDPAFAYEIAVIVREGLRRMYTDREDCFYYLTVTNENYPMPAVPGDIDDDVVAGMYRYLRIGEAAAPQVTLLASGAIVNEAVAAAHLLADRFAVSSDVWSVTSWSELRRDALATERWNLLHPEARPHVPRFTSNLADGGGPIIAASDYLKAVPDALARWAPRRMQVLGTDGFGRSDTREALRDFFEVDARHIAFAAVAELYRDAALPAADVERARKELAIDPDRPDPVCC
ncbi:MAG: pyruvate dehydrogenase (acetyl-transferring), homodimeric type [Deltaproteobacteria bacterium]|nr:MAG: pyruvate dehydrogenase (acetyl-transferring), homodimeric type [Deltaproteobacteria bacterium]